MTASSIEGPSPSAAFFCPQGRAPDTDQLAGLYAYLNQTRYGETLLRKVSKLGDCWEIFAEANNDVKALSQGPKDLNILRNWATRGECGPLAAVRSGIVAMPLLMVLQIGQYLRYLEFYGLSHQDFLSSIWDAGGAQGYCGGLPAATAIACAKNEDDLIQITSVMLRLLVGIGAYSEGAGDEGGGSTMLMLRSKNEAQGEELTRRFPGTYVSSVTDPRSICIVGSASKLDALFEYARGQKLQVQKMEISGKVHNPENDELAAGLCDLCHNTPSLTLPDASELQVCVRSNKNGERLTRGSLAAEIITTILASKCEWHSLLTEVAADLEASTRFEHKFVNFGLSDCVPMVPFHGKDFKPSKYDAYKLIPPIRVPSDLDGNLLDPSAFHEQTIAIVGASCRFPGASNLEELWNLMAKADDSHQEVSKDRFDIPGSSRATQSGKFASDRKFYGNFLEDVEGFDHSFFGVNAKAAASTDPQQRLLLELSYEALESSGYLAIHRREAGDNVGCFVGSALVEHLDITSTHPPSADRPPGTIPESLCGRLSHQYGWTGPAEVIDTTCSSSLVAIHRACKAIVSGECSMALAGGVNIITSVNNYVDLGKAGFLSPTGQCKPFDEAADGYCRADGAGLVVLKSMKQAIADGDEIMGLIPAIATNQGGLSATITIPHYAAQQSLYRAVLKQSGLKQEQITYVESHGNGTQAGDIIEMQSIRAVIGGTSRSTKASIGSVKGNIGHSEAAAGVASLLKVIAMFKHGQIPPQANHTQLNQNISPLEPDGLEITRKLCGWDAPFRAALVNNHGAAGSNCALICCEMPNKGTLRPRKLPTKNDHNSFTVVISAATHTSLVEYARVLAAYIQRSSNLDIGDISFTLNQKRQRHKYSFNITSKSSAELARSLEAFVAEPSGILEVPQNSKPIVLSFSGQYDNKVELNRSLYEKCPAFRSHINACNKELNVLGFDSIIPSIFQSRPISNFITLQCGIFAVQYACARSWIDAGLKVDVIIGHSLGELSALAISGVLSLSDCIKLIASRAELMETQRSSRKGAMLALTCTTDDSKRISTRLSSTSNKSKLEIASFNGPKSLVAVGSSATIEATEKLLTSDPEFKLIKFKRLTTNYGFHSTLTTPILSDLSSVSKGLQWNEPSIPLEFCTATRLESIRDYDVCSHARNPVYFSEAVRRIEVRFGACVWLEAGINSPVISMVRQAARQPELQEFYAMKLQSGRPAIDAVSNVISSLRKSGLSLSHWSSLSPRYKSIWLPPYQFDKPPHWRENINRAIEAQSNSVNAEDTRIPLPVTSQLVTRKTADLGNSGATEFVVNTQCERFRKFVGGHVVRSQPLCPPSMYMECVTMAVLILMESFGESSLVFEEVNFQSALDSAPDGDVIICLEKSAINQSWKFSVESTTRDPKTKPKSHVNGVISLTPAPMFDIYSRLVSSTTERLRNCQQTERLKSNRAYGLFALVVDYDDFFRGIQSIAIDGQEAVATIAVPDNQPNRDESTSWRVCDTATIDSFIQVVGLLMNSSDAVLRDEVMIMVGLDRAVISPSCKMDDPTSWQVYTKFAWDQDGQATGDVFVSSPQDELVAMLVGCRFKKLLIPKLERALDTLNSLDSVNSPPLKTAILPTPESISSDRITTESVITRPESVLSNTSTIKGVIVRPESTFSNASTILEGIITRPESISSDRSTTKSVMTRPDSTLSNTSTISEGVITRPESISSDRSTTEGVIVRPESTFSNTSTTENVIIRPESISSDRSTTESDMTRPESILSNTSTIKIFMTRRESNSSDRSIEAVMTRPESTLSNSSTTESVTTRRESISSDRSIEIFMTRRESNSSDRSIEVVMTRPESILSDSSTTESVMTRPDSILSSTSTIEAFMTRPDSISSNSSTTESVTTPVTPTDEEQRSLPREPILENTGFENSPSPRNPILPDLKLDSWAAMDLIGEFASTLDLFTSSDEFSNTTMGDLMERIGTGFTEDKSPNPSAKSPTVKTHVRSRSESVSPKHLGDRSYQLFLRLLAEVSGANIEDIKLFSTLSELGVDSFSAVVLKQELEEAFSVSLDDLLLECKVRELMKQMNIIDRPTRARSHQVTRSGTQKPKGSHRLETIVYKEVDGVQIHADVYFPIKPKSPRLAIALLVHGGGHMTLSRRAIRAHQTQHLIANGILPVSIDYRLCPEIDIINGPMTDVCDAYTWIQNSLPKIAAHRHGLQLNTKKIMVVGWSTGGQLAMSVGWMAKSKGLPPPLAVLSFYAPVDLESTDIDEVRPLSIKARKIKTEQIISSLPRTPITNYDVSRTDGTNLGGAQFSDPRSELVLSLFKEGNSLPFLIRGLPKKRQDGSFEYEIPAPAEIASISPLAQLRAGNYDIPTFIIHSTADKIAPFAGAKRFVDCLKQKGIRHGFLELDGVENNYDLTLKPGSKGWETQIGPGYDFLYDMMKN